MEYQNEGQEEPAKQRGWGGGGIGNIESVIETLVECSLGSHDSVEAFISSR